jgi:hypothetical protein
VEGSTLKYGTAPDQIVPRIRTAPTIAPRRRRSLRWLLCIALPALSSRTCRPQLPRILSVPQTNEEHGCSGEMAGWIDRSCTHIIARLHFERSNSAEPKPMGDFPRAIMVAAHYCVSRSRSADRPAIPSPFFRSAMLPIRVMQATILQLLYWPGLKGAGRHMNRTETDVQGTEREREGRQASWGAAVIDTGFGTVQRLHLQSCTAQPDCSFILLLSRVPACRTDKSSSLSANRGCPVQIRAAAVSGLPVFLHNRDALGHMTCLRTFAAVHGAQRSPAPSCRPPLRRA